MTTTTKAAHPAGPYRVSRSQGHLLVIFRKGRRQAICVFTTGETDDTHDLVGANKYAAKICMALNIMHRAAAEARANG